MPGTTGVVWSLDEIAGLASQKFFCDDLAQAIALAQAESGFKPFCVSANNISGMANYSEDSGLWQMNDLRKNLDFEFGSGGNKDLQLKVGVKLCVDEALKSQGQNKI